MCSYCKLNVCGAGSHKINHFGQRAVSLVRAVNGETVDVRVIFEVCDVREPILSSTQLSECGWSTVLGPKESCLFHHEAGLYLPLQRQRKGWYLMLDKVTPLSSSSIPSSVRRLYVKSLRAKQREHDQCTVPRNSIQARHVSEVDEDDAMIDADAERDEPTRFTSTRRRLSTKTSPSSLPPSHPDFRHASPLSGAVQSSSPSAVEHSVSPSSPSSARIPPPPSHSESSSAPAVMMKTPKAPTPLERAQHNLTHQPHQQWCEHCISGRSVDAPHRKQNAVHRSLKDSLDSLPTVQLDY